MKLTLVAAVARNGVIGRDNDMPWRLPEDLKHFRRVTLGAPVLMGRRTWDSLPAAFKPLPGRRNVVITRNPDWHVEGAEAAPSLEAALQRLADAAAVYVVGGAQLYAQALERADELVLTEIDRDFEGDTRFPDFDRGRFTEVARETHRAAPPNDFDFAFVTYRRQR
ncbi:dihydrofolate reductase [Azohydromonas caseinilytica]|uniref:Dihydrofolate reductase n=1 Tax=Azohydromonas caseinilytica TaxID=2728836 RepID=A0A848F7L4_9BURK|nr:dihydrofolate reductase [Azohydromonas caseinilytica]NML15564.1 dihydrofolate reductase [Azohydromonas caseinilytica]